MTPKRMSKERRAEIVADIESTWRHSSLPVKDYIDGLIADSAYWRAAVRETRTPTLFSLCVFCAVADYQHHTDCPYLLAKEDQ